MPKLTIRLLGPFQVHIDDRPVTKLNSNKVRALLAYLAMEIRRTHSRAAIAELLWPMQPSGRARANLSQAIYNLRRTLNDQGGSSNISSSLKGDLCCLLTTRDSIQLNPAWEMWVDVHNFIARIQANNHHQHPDHDLCNDCIVNLEHATTLYRGDFLENLAIRQCIEYEEWQRIEQERLRQLANQAYQNLAEYSIRCADFTHALELSERQLEIDPLQESAHRRVMRMLALNGERNKALTHFKEYCRLIDEELGVPPESETITLYDRIKNEEEFSLEQTDPAHYFLTRLVPLVGRKRELGELRHQLLDPDCCLLTIVGPGGSGKTRLAIEFARTLTGRFSHGIHIVTMNALETNVGLVSALLKSLNISIEKRRSNIDQLFDYIRKKELLLLMDSFENLLSGADLVAEMLAIAPGLKILTTSRIRLNLQNEYLYPLSGLSYPEDENSIEIKQYDAVNLYLHSARLVQPFFELDAQNTASVYETCQLVEGMPLAILLAAAWVSTLSPAKILNQIRENYDFLQANWAHLPLRHRSMRATFDYSWNLLDTHEQKIQQALSVFSAGFTLEAVKYVTGATVYELRTLIEKSLLGHIGNERYVIHDLIQQYSTEKLEVEGDADFYYSRHSRYYLRLVSKCETSIKSARRQEVIDILDIEYPNIIAAWVWAVGEGSYKKIQSAIESLGIYCEFSARFSEGETLCRIAIERLSKIESSRREALLKANLLTWHSRFSRLNGDYDRAAIILEKSRTIIDQATEAGLDTRQAQAFVSLEAAESIFPTDLDTAQKHLQESLDLYLSLEDQWWIALCQLHLAKNNTQLSNYAEAAKFYRMSLNTQEKLGEPRLNAMILIWYAYNFVRQGQIEDGIRKMDQAVILYESLGDKLNIARARMNLGTTLIWQGGFQKAKRLLESSLPLHREIGNRPGTVHTIVSLSITCMMMGDYKAASSHSLTAYEMALNNDMKRYVALALYVMGSIALAKGDYLYALDRLQKSELLLSEHGHIDELGWTLTFQANAQLALNQSSKALKLIIEALEMALNHRIYNTTLLCLIIASLIFIKEGHVERAVEISMIARRAPHFVKSVFMADFAWKKIDAASTHLPPEMLTAAQERGQSAELFATATEVLEEFKEREDIIGAFGT